MFLEDIVLVSVTTMRVEKERSLKIELGKLSSNLQSGIVLA